MLDLLLVLASAAQVKTQNSDFHQENMENSSYLCTQFQQQVQRYISLLTTNATLYILIAGKA